MAEYDPGQPGVAEYDPGQPVAAEADEAYNSDALALDEREAEANGNVDVEQEEEEDDDYDPSSFRFDETAGDARSEHMHTDSAPVTTAPPAAALPTASKPKTIGGFLVDDDDDEEEEAAVAPTGGAIASPDTVAAPSAAVQDVRLLASEAQDTAAPLSAPSLPPNASTPPVSLPDSSAPISALSTSAPALTVSEHAAPSGPDQGKQSTHVSTTGTFSDQIATATPQPPAVAVAAPPTSTAIPNGVSTSSTQRLPHDKVGDLEERIKQDPKGDTEAWKSLIAHYREKGQLDNARKVYSRFFDVFPSAASMWVEYAQMELEHDNLQNVEQIFSLSLLQLPNVDMWNLYMDYLRRVHPLNPDPDGSKRGIISSAFDFLLENVGIDPDSGRLWRDYVDFVKSGPGVVGGSGWQDAQKMDLVRKAYQRAIKLPHSELTKLWKEYDNFELGLNKATGRKNLQDNSPSYMAARSAKNQLDHRMEGLNRNLLPMLPPIYGCAGDDYFNEQVDKWLAWIAWEKEDPIHYKDEEDEATLRKRVLYAYKQATMQLRFYPQIWFEAATWCFEQSTDELGTEGEQFLKNGMEANPESVLLALMKADRVESSLEQGTSDEIAIRNGEKLDPVFVGVHKPLYALHKKMQERIAKEVAAIQERYANITPELVNDHDGNDGPPTQQPSRAEQMKEEIDTYRSLMGARLDELKKTISYVWVAKMRAFRRIQGQGAPNKPKKGLRGVFAEARPQGQLTSAVYIASAQMEWCCYRDPSAMKIFERGLKLFPLDETFTLEYIKHLLGNNDAVNANATYNTFIHKIKTSEKLSQADKRDKCRALLEYMHEYESNYGDLPQIHKVEREMADLYPEELDVRRFGARNALPDFNALQVQLLLSPTQHRPKAEEQVPNQHLLPPHASIEAPRSPPENSHIRLGPNGPYVASPKRALDDYSDSEAPQRKFLRGESPFKGGSMGSSGARIGSGGGGGFVTKNYIPAAAAAPAPLPKDVHWLLSILPNAATYNAFGTSVFDPFKMVEFLRGVDPSRVRLR